MIIDTSALVSVGWREAGFETIFEAMLTCEGLIPAPVLVEFRRVTSLSGNRPDVRVDDFLADLILVGE